MACGDITVTGTVMASVTATMTVRMIVGAGQSDPHAGGVPDTLPSRRHGDACQFQWTLATSAVQVTGFNRIL